MRLLFVGLISLLANFAWASDFDGAWQGVGTYEATGWGSFSADPVVIQINQSGNILSSKDCWSFLRDGANWRVCSSTDLEIIGTGLFSQGYRVGSISGNRIDISYNLEGNLIEAVVELQNNGTLSYSYQATETSSGRIIKTQAAGLTR
jgi:hypothetical protein